MTVVRVFKSILLIDVFTVVCTTIVAAYCHDKRQKAKEPKATKQKATKATKATNPIATKAKKPDWEKVHVLSKITVVNCPSKSSKSDEQNKIYKQNGSQKIAEKCAITHR